MRQGLTCRPLREPALGAPADAVESLLRDASSFFVVVVVKHKTHRPRA